MIKKVNYQLSVYGKIDDRLQFGCMQLEYGVSTR